MQDCASYAFLNKKLSQNFGLKQWFCCCSWFCGLVVTWAGLTCAWSCGCRCLKTPQKLDHLRWSHSHVWLLVGVPLFSSMVFPVDGLGLVHLVNSRFQPQPEKSKPEFTRAVQTSTCVMFANDPRQTPGCSRAGVDGTVQGRAPRKAWFWGHRCNYLPQSTTNPSVYFWNPE